MPSFGFGGILFVEQRQSQASLPRTQERALEKNVNGAVKPPLARFDGFRGIEPLDEVPPVTWSERLEGFPSFRMAFQSRAQVGWHGKFARRAVEPEFHTYNVACIYVSCFAQRRVDLHPETPAACRDKRHSCALPVHKRNDGNVPLAFARLS